MTFWSFSRTFTAYHLLLGALTVRRSATLDTAASTSSLKISFGSGTSLLCATFTASSMSSPSPVFFSAEVSTTGQPRTIDSLFESIFRPLFPIRSDMLSAMTTGIPVSMSCVVR